MKKAIEEVGQMVRQSELGRLTTVTKAWNDIEWNDVNQSTGMDVAINTSKPTTINIFPAFDKLTDQRKHAAIAREFGLSLYRRFATDAAKQRWELKLTLPESAQIDAIQAKLQEQKYETFKELMESFSTLMDRYVCLNVTNALLANGVKRSDARNLNIRQYGCTLEYANIRKMHSLKAYVTAYGPRDVSECPGRGFAEKLVYKMGHITESSLAAAYGRLIIEVFVLCRD